VATGNPYFEFVSLSQRQQATPQKIIKWYTFTELKLSLQDFFCKTLSSFVNFWRSYWRNNRLYFVWLTLQ